MFWVVVSFKIFIYNYRLILFKFLLYGNRKKWKVLLVTVEFFTKCRFTIKKSINEIHAVDHNFPYCCNILSKVTYSCLILLYYVFIMYIYLYITMSIYKSTYTSLDIFIYVNIYTYLYTFVCVHIYRYL